jgi:peptide-methionine (S)-S-oxide reductase
MRRIYIAGFTLALVAQAGVAIAAPAPDFDPKISAPQEQAILSGGCFWGMQGVFEHVKGVSQVVAGYTGGAAGTAQYETVSTGSTGHAESVRITFNPSVISYGQILQIFVTVAADPTELNYQGPDSGTQYRSEIWYAPTDQQQKIAHDYLAQLTAAKTFSSPIAVRVDPAQPFYPAEAYHQNFLILHPDDPYIDYNDIPKLQALKTQFPQFYMAQPVVFTVADAGN